MKETFKNPDSCITHLECSLCSSEYSASRLINTCLKDAKPLLARYDLKKASKTLIEDRMHLRCSSMWRYSEVLPIQDSANIVSLGEGFTPLIEPYNLREHLQMPNLYIKDESLNPTLSFKARGLSCAVSRAYELGAESFSLPSAGNAASALSAYAAHLGKQAHVFIPSSTPEANIQECRMFGADVHLVDGFITDAARICSIESQKNGWFEMSTLREPYRLEGKKTMGYEMAEQLDVLPDVIIYPTGGGTGLVGIWKAFAEMEAMGWIGAKRPRMISVQAEGCSPLYNAYIAGDTFAKPISNPETFANGLLVPSAVGDFVILDAVRSSNGLVTTVSDSQIMDALKLISATTGMFVAPEAAATIAALKDLLQSRTILSYESVLVVNTGSGIKYLDVIPQF